MDFAKFEYENAAPADKAAKLAAYRTAYDNYHSIQEDYGKAKSAVDRTEKMRQTLQTSPRVRDTYIPSYRSGRTVVTDATKTALDEAGNRIVDAAGNPDIQNAAARGRYTFEPDTKDFDGLVDDQTISGR